MRFRFCCPLLLFSSALLAQIHLVPHITDPAGSFTTQLILTAETAASASYRLAGYDRSGALLGRTEGVVAGRSSVISEATTLLPYPTLSHVVVESGEGLAVNLVYQSRTAGSGPAHAVASKTQSETWRLFAGNTAVTWDGLAVVNTGTAATEVRALLQDDSGQTVSEVVLQASLAPMAKQLAVLSSLLPPQAGYRYEIRATEPLALTALRGDSASTLLWQNQAVAIASPTTYTSDFTPPSGLGSDDPDLEGPGHFRIMFATSTDGQSFTATGELFTDQGNVPDIVQTEDGTLFLYYTGWNMGNVDNRTSVGISQDNGQTWVYKYLTLTNMPPGFPGVDPDIVLLPDGTFRLFLTGGLNTGNIGIWYAEGTDGLHFEGQGLAASVTGRNVLDSSAFELDGTWHMYALNSENTELWYFTSSNGTSFTQQGASPIRFGSADYVLSNGLQAGANYRMYGFFLPEKHLASFLTSNGTTWTKEGTSLSFPSGSPLEVSYFKDPAVVRLQDGTYLMAYVTRIDEH